ncbi:hypothetical protein [Reichenbachiella sp. MALMAid0571]|uniref:hypothetical protein n=1 Tax=Reichenbachiella sp. MALMAid0571 TaxID=3143939 RepID=UPI0032DEB66A
MNCVTNKRCYETKEMAEEALIQNRSRNHHAPNTGPVNVYHCHECGNYHFTSKGPSSEILNAEDVKRKIALGKEASYWEDKYRRR